MADRRTGFDVVGFNRLAWDRQVAGGNPWTVPADHETIAAARRGEWAVVLTASRLVPRAWFPPLPGLDILCLACGGGQQGPVFAAAGAAVTVLDNSPAQLNQDRMVAKREGLDLRTVQGTMDDLSAFADATFDLVFHPVSNVFAPAVRPVWLEAYRVLRPGGSLLAGFMNPAAYIFDVGAIESRGLLRVRHRLPYRDVEHLGERRVRRMLAEGVPLEHSHTLEDQLGGQCDAGFTIAGLFEDRYPEEDLVSEYMPVFIATRAVKPPAPPQEETP
jgi:SAM-dependent methyltransferase